MNDYTAYFKVKGGFETHAPSAEDAYDAFAESDFGDMTNLETTGDCCYGYCYYGIKVEGRYEVNVSAENIIDAYEKALTHVNEADFDELKGADYDFDHLEDSEGICYTEADIEDEKER